MSKKTDKPEQSQQHDNEPTGASDPAELASMNEVAHKLENVAQNFKLHQEQSREIQQTQGSLKQAMTSIMQGVETLTKQTERPQDAGSMSSDTKRPPLGNADRDNGCCDCISANCCCFKFIFRSVRMLAGQGGIDQIVDGETLTGIAGEQSGMECQFYVSIDGSGIIVPNQIWSYIQLRKRMYRPGVWYNIDRTVNCICIPRGIPKSYPFIVQAVELEVSRTEQLALAGMKEFGSETASVTFDCNCTRIGPIYVTISLDGGGIGRGILECSFDAELCCCC